jgi:D-alanyl-lipoteichoic acid acyltransferase DltB (MBOAT superfamily)
VLALGDQTPTVRRGLVTVGLLLNFASLATFKYLNQVLAMAAPSARPFLAVAIPAGISFYTFHQAVFLVHAYSRRPEVVKFLKGAETIRGRAAAFVRYAAFVAFFPQLVIGPITYMSEFAPQVELRRFGRLQLINIEVGVTLMVIGLFKKVVMADTLATFANPVFHDLATGAPITREQALLAIASYFFQLYFDFSGYSDMAIGIARAFGLRLPMNFDSPLRATGIVDFYRRWHMTLTRVIVLFVFTPLSLNGTRFAMRRGMRDWRVRALGAWAPFLLNFEIIALWHAAKFTFLLFGLIHGIWYVLETEVRANRLFRRFRSGTSESLRTVGGIALTVAPLALTFALFRSNSLHGFWALLHALMGGGPQPTFEAGHVNRRIWLEVAAAAGIVYALPNAYEALRAYRPAIRTFDNRSITPTYLRVAWRPNLLWAMFISALAVASIFKLNVPSPFLYGGF